MVCPCRVIRDTRAGVSLNVNERLLVCPMVRVTRVGVSLERERQMGWGLICPCSVGLESKSKANERERVASVGVSLVFLLSGEREVRQLASL